jgi:hypothetical protein
MSFEILKRSDKSKYDDFSMTVQVCVAGVDVSKGRDSLAKGMIETDGVVPVGTGVSERAGKGEAESVGKGEREIVGDSEFERVGEGNGHELSTTVGRGLGNGK